MGDETSGKTGAATGGTGAAATGAAATGAAATAAKTGAAATGQTGAPIQTGQGQQTASTKAKAVASVLEGSVEHVRDETTGDEGAGKESAASWPEDWREQASSGDEKLLKLSKRYGSVNGMLSAFANLRARLDGGGFTKNLDKDATPDEIAQFRKDNNIPEKPEGYELPKGVEIGEEDKPIIEKMLQHWHGQNRTPEQVQGDINHYFELRAIENQQKYDHDIAYRDEQLDALNAKYGREFPAFRNALKNFVPNFFGKELGEALMGARLADGTIAGNNGIFLSKMYDFARMHAPEQTLTNAGAGGSEKAIADEIAEIEKLQRTDRNKYFADEKMQARYQTLIAAQLKAAENKKAA